MTNRPEIDGLRAIAALLILFYHAELNLFAHQFFKGGFIGVDIFFVISGYLISSMILKELFTTGSFTFKHFYSRRIRRILPVLLFIMLVSLPFAWIYLLPNSFIDFSRSILYSIGFISNFYFYYSNQVYGAESVSFKPFFHTWSLSIEVQYYILFPIVLLVIFKYFKKYLIHILIIIFLTSLALVYLVNKNHPLFNFYLLPTRAFELLAGSILAYFEIKKKRGGGRSKNKKLNLILPGIGLFLIIQSFVFFNNIIYHPSLYTLICVIGVCLIIWFSNKNEIITKILSTKLFVGIGLISFSLYLWHYPIFAFARVNNFFTENLSQKLFLIAVVFILSFLSYHFIEKPARKKDIDFKIIFSLIVITIIVLISFNTLVIKKNGFKNRLPEILKIDDEDFGDLEKEIANTFLDKKNNSSEIIFNKVYLIGDSHMNRLEYDLKEKLIKKNYQFTSSVKGRCFYFVGFDLINLNTGKADKDCNNDYFKKLRANLLKEKNSIIIFGGRLPLYLSNKYFDNKEGGIEGGQWEYKYNKVGEYENIGVSFKNEVLEIAKENYIVLIYPIPEAGWNPSKKIYLQWLKRDSKIGKNFSLKYVTTSFQVYKDRSESSFDLLNNITGKNILRIYPDKLFCNTIIIGRCVNHDDNLIFYSDDNHLTIKISKKINDLIVEEIKKIETKKK